MSMPLTAKPYRFDTSSFTILTPSRPHGPRSPMYLWGAVAIGFPFLDHPGPLAFAHRGGSAEAPENSWAAFEHAISLGYRYLETDVRATADGVVAALHDPTLDRVADRPGTLAKMTWAEVQKTKLGDGREIPLLEELLSAWPEARWNIDVKTPEAVAPVVDALRRTGSVDRVLVAAFGGRRSAQVRSALGPTLATGAGRATVAALVAAKFGLRAAPRSPAVAAQVPLQLRGVRIVDAAFLRVCHQAGMVVHVWTIDDPAVMERLLDLGVDGIMTDRPSTLKEVMERRGQWG
jgi:glycerophosphoryl diester phosphodiesterase